MTNTLILYSRKTIIFCLLWFGLSSILVSNVSLVHAQRITYNDLLQKVEAPHIYIDHFTLPSKKSGQVNFATTFRIDYNLIRFKKQRPSAQQETNTINESPDFKASLTLNLELFTSKTQENKRKFRETDLQSLTPVKRAFWKETVYADTYEQTQSKKHYLSGYLNVQATPGYYKYLFQIGGKSATSQPVNRSRFVEIKDPSKAPVTSFYYVDSLVGDNKPKQATLINFGNNVNYGKDFHLLFSLPDADNKGYRIEVQKININKQDTIPQEQVFQQDLKKHDILTSLFAKLVSDSTRLELVFSYNNEYGKRYGLIRIPNSQFENGKYQIVLRKNDSNTVLKRDVYQSHWINMPVSLLNIDVSIRMLRFILEDQKIEKMLKGSRDERIQAFKKFWREKDPTPETAFNELMAEYYHRIDRAYEQFSTINQPGFKTDRGKIYIQRGSPDSIKRKFPSDQRAIEIWNYRNKTYIFRATSGFGDFKLVSEK